MSCFCGSLPGATGFRRLAGYSPEILALDEQFEDDSDVQAVMRTISRLDLQELRQVYLGTGSKPYPPELMLAVVLDEILAGLTSPALWFRDATSRDQCKLVDPVEAALDGTFAAANASRHKSTTSNRSIVV